MDRLDGGGGMKAEMVQVGAFYVKRVYSRLGGDRRKVETSPDGTNLLSSISAPTTGEDQPY